MTERAAVSEIEKRAYDGFKEVIRDLAARQDYPSTLARSDALEAEHAPALIALGAWESARSVRVWFADARLMAAMATGQSLDYCEALLARRLALVAGEPADRALTIGAFCGHAVRAGAPARAIIYLVPLVEELEAALTRPRDPGAPAADLIERALESIQTILKRARAARETEGTGP